MILAEQVIDFARKLGVRTLATNPDRADADIRQPIVDQIGFLTADYYSRVSTLDILRCNGF